MNQQRFAYSFDMKGDKRRNVYLATIGEENNNPEPILESVVDCAWSASDKAIYYVGINENDRPDRVLKHTLGFNASEDKLVYKEDDEKYHVTFGHTRDSEYIQICKGDWESCEITLFKDVDDDKNGKYTKCDILFLCNT